MSRSKVIASDTPSYADDYLCLTWKESTQNCMCRRAGAKMCHILAVLLQIRSWMTSKIQVKVKGRCTRHTLCQIWKESIQNCTCCRADPPKKSPLWTRKLSIMSRITKFLFWLLFQDFHEGQLFVTDLIISENKNRSIYQLDLNADS